MHGSVKFDVPAGRWLDLAWAQPQFTADESEVHFAKASKKESCLLKPH